MARTFAITYGTYVIGLSGTDSEVRLTDKIRMSQDYDSADVTFEVVVLAASAGAFLTVEADLIAAYTKPDQDLLIQVGGSTRYTFDQSSNTGFNARPRIEKLGGIEDTDRSARYRLTVSTGLPADLSGKDGRQASSVSVSWDPSSIRTVTISGTYTALASNSARAQYEASIAAYVATVKSALSVTDWNLVGRPTETEDDNGKVFQFSRVYLEQIFDQAAGGTRDVAAIVNPQLRIRRVHSATNDTVELGQTEPLISLSASYTCNVDHSVTTDLATLYTDTILPMILEEAKELAGEDVIIMREAPVFSPVGNRVFVDLDLEADPGTPLFAATIETEELKVSGEVRLPVWSGDPYHWDVYQGHKTHLIRVRKSVLRRKGSQVSILSDAPLGFRENSLVRKVSPRTLGRSTGNTLAVEFVVVSQEFERITSIQTATDDAVAIASDIGDVVEDVIANIADGFF